MTITVLRNIYMPACVFLVVALHEDAYGGMLQSRF